MKLLTATIILQYCKQGDDLNNCMRQLNNNISESLLIHANFLKIAAQQLEDIENEINKVEVEVTIDADGYYIGITGPEDFINELATKGLVIIENDDEWEDESEEDEDLLSDEHDIWME